MKQAHVISIESSVDNLIRNGEGWLSFCSQIFILVAAPPFSSHFADD